MFEIDVLQYKQCSPVKVLETLLLLKLRMERVYRYLQHLKQRHQPPNTIDTTREHERSAGIAEQEVVKIEVLCRTVSFTRPAQIQSDLPYR